jgi:sigma-B regulation protein RsbU (phosphoserine phosphatase)
LRTRLGEEARFVLAADRWYGGTPDFPEFLGDFCRATDVIASPEHQVAVLADGDRVISHAAEHAHHRLDPSRLAASGIGSWLIREGENQYLVRVSEQEGKSVVVAESLQAVLTRLRSSLLSHAAWLVGSGLLLIGVVNLIMSRAVLRPVRHLYRAARKMEGGELGVEVPVAGGDELGLLGERFNAMSRAIAAQVEADRRELEAARQVQEQLLPQPAARIGCLEVAGRCVQAHPVGGDLYDVQTLSDERVGVVVADLSGHNVAAALHTAMVRAMLWREAERAATPGEALTRLNERLCRHLPEEHFATILFGWFEPRQRRFVYSNAGHPAGLLRYPGASLRTLEALSVPLGIVPQATYESVALELEPGTLMLAYTDGLSETRNPEGEMFGEQRVSSALIGFQGQELLGFVDGLLSGGVDFRRSRPQEDYVTVVAARFEPAD